MESSRLVEQSQVTRERGKVRGHLLVERWICRDMYNLLHCVHSYLKELFCSAYFSTILLID